MEYPKNESLEKRFKELDDFVAKCDADIKQIKDHIKRAKKEKTKLKKIIENG